MFAIPEQVVVDDIAGVTIEFFVKNGTSRMRIWRSESAIVMEGACRDILFDDNGLAGSTGTYTCGGPTPSKLPEM